MGQEERKSSGRRPLLLLGAAVVVIVISAVICLRAGLFGGSFSIDNAVVCIELDRNRRPHKVRQSVQYGVRQVCLWFQYSSAPEGNHLEISWYYEDEKVLSESLKLMTEDGMRAFYLLQEEGTPLPAGKYRVTISSATKVLSSLDFEIIKKQ